jgi:hypothetical protein
MDEYAKIYLKNKLEKKQEESKIGKKWMTSIEANVKRRETQIKQNEINKSISAKYHE